MNPPWSKSIILPPGIEVRSQLCRYSIGRCPLEQESLMKCAKKIWLARHGERLDAVDPNWVKESGMPFDPPLSSRGVQQSRELANFARSLDLRHLISSPYRRTLETSAFISDATELKIKTEPAVGEFLLADWFDSTPTLSKPKNIVRRAPARPQLQWRLATQISRELPHICISVWISLQSTDFQARRRFVCG